MFCNTSIKIPVENSVNISDGHLVKLETLV